MKPLEIEIDARGRSVAFPPAGRTVRGRLTFIDAAERDAVSGLKTFAKDHLPGQVIGLDDQGGFIRERLREDAYSLSLEAAEKFGRVGPARENIKLDVAQRRAWLWHMKRLVDDGHACVVSGEFPTCVEPPAPVARTADPVERLCVAIEGLLSRMAPAKA